jgi:hypothetical protein
VHGFGLVSTRDAAAFLLVPRVSSSCRVACSHHNSFGDGRRRRSRRFPSASASPRIFKTNIKQTIDIVQLYSSILPPDNYNDDAPPFSDKESPRDRARRMSMARELQSIYYKAPSPPPPPTLQTSSFIQQPTTQMKKWNDSNNSLVYGSTVLRNLPTITTHDGIDGEHALSAILPGYQFIWNIHNPQHCHMFHSILSGPAPWYFAHVQLPNVTPTTSTTSTTTIDPSFHEGQGTTAIIDSMESYNSIQNRLKFDNTPLFGTLLRVTDRRFQDDDGRIVLAVQAIDRVRVHNVASMPGTFLTTDVQMAPEIELMHEFFDKAIMSSASYISSLGDDASDITDVEDGDRDALVRGAARAAAAADAYRTRRFEYLPIVLEEKPTRLRNDRIASKSPQSPVDNDKQSETKLLDEGGPEYVSVVQLCNYDAFESSSLENTDLVTAQALKTYWERLAMEKSRSTTSSSEVYSDLVCDNESSAPSTSFFLPELDSSSSSAPMPFSSGTCLSSEESVAAIEIRVWCSLDEMIRLLSVAAAGADVPIPTQLLGLLPIHNNWPSNFALETFAASLAASSSAVIGTAFKSPFVRVDQIVASVPSSSIISTYSPLRRAQRLSNAIWLLLDGLAMMGADPPPPPHDEILAMNIEERLNAALQTLDGINFILKKIIPENQ